MSSIPLCVSEFSQSSPRESDSCSIAKVVCAAADDCSVWAPLHPNCIVDITESMELKMQALSCYTSQLAMNNYLDSVRGLNAYRSIANHSRGYAEAYFRVTAREYRELAGSL